MTRGPDAIEKNLWLARGRGAHRPDGAPAATVGRGWSVVADHPVAQDRRRRLHRTAVHADRALRAPGPRRSQAPGIYNPSTASAAAHPAGAVRPAPVRRNGRRRIRAAADRRAGHLRADGGRRVLQPAEDAEGAAARRRQRRLAEESELVASPATKKEG